MQIMKWLWLQMFAEGDGGAGSDGGAATAETGVDGGDPGHQRLLELGVPKEKLRKRAYREAAKAEAAKAEAPATQTEGQTPPAEEKPTEGSSKRMTWDEIVADPEYGQQLQNTIKTRLKGAKSAEENLKKLAPAIEVMARRYGHNMENLDYEALARDVDGDRDYYEDLAIELGTSVEGAMVHDRKKRAEQREAAEKQRQQQEQQDALKQQMTAMHIRNVRAQAETMKGKYPGFDLDAEMRNPTFAKLTSPSINMSVEDAYWAVHRRELQAAAAKATAQMTAAQISNAIQSGTSRPAEAGTSSQSPSVSSFSWKNATPQQREAQRRAIRDAAAQGRKVYPGQR